MTAEGLNVLLPRGDLRAAMVVSLLSVWMLVGLFSYLNRYTKREYFTFWTAAWLFYALWLTLNFEMPDARPGGIAFTFKQSCVAISAVFLLWGSLRFLSLPSRQTLFGLFMLFLLVWTSASPKALANNLLAIQLPIFILLGFSSVFASGCFFRLRRKMPFVGAGLLSAGFLLWGLYLASYPFSLAYKDFSSAEFFIGAVLQLFIAVSMVVLVLEEVRFNAEQVRAEIAAVRSEKEALQMRVLSTEEECRDLYNKVRLSEGLQQAYEELRRTQQMVVQQERLRALGQMASGVAHDINNALTPIVGYTDLLLVKSPNLPKSVRDALQIINQSGNDAAHIVARMREFYRQRADTERLAEVDLNEIIGEVVELTRPRWRDISQREGVSINIRLELEPGLPLLWSDPGELREALINLVFNAVDAMPLGGTINLATRSLNHAADRGDKPGEPRVQIEVRDDGVGMDESTRQRCLEPFFTTKAQRGGTGLGLAMVYGMMQRHEGSIEIESLPGKGACVRLVFPLRKVLSEIPVRPATPRKQSRSLNVLCIDDEEPIRELMSVCLAHFKHQVAVASSGREGLKLFNAARLETKPFDIVITDMGLPDIDGHQVAREIKAESPGTPIIMLTGWGSIMREDKVTTPEVDALVDKPPRMNQLNDLLLRLAVQL